MLRTRVQTGVVLGIVVTASILLLDTRLASLVFGVFWLIGAYEWARLTGLAGAYRVLFVAVVAVLMAAEIAGGLPSQLSLLLPGLALACWVVMFGLIMRFPRPLPGWPLVLIGLVVLPGAWFGFHLLHAVRPGLVLAALVMVWSADTGAFFVGRAFGRTPLAPRVSPKKTWEGVFGGLAGAALAGLLAALILDLPVLPLVALAVVAAPVSVCGDLGISMIKRRAGVKDSGSLLPGHGGILDRFDGVTAALPLIALGLQFAHVLD